MIVLGKRLTTFFSQMRPFVIDISSVAIAITPGHKVLGGSQIGSTTLTLIFQIVAYNPLIVHTNYAFTVDNRFDRLTEIGVKLSSHYR